MNLPVMPPVAPMLAKLSPRIPDAGEMLFEPKWDGFRCIAFRDGDEVELGSRKEKPLTRYFPDVAAAVLAQFPPRCVVDGEIVIAGANGLDFDALLQRIHPADSRVRRLAEETPASFVAFDLLALGDRDLRPLPFVERRSMLVDALASAHSPVHVTPATSDRAVAEDWFERFEGAGLDGVVAKPLELPYLEDQRAMVKIKHERTADCVVAGFRWHKSGPVVGSLLLGLYDDAGVLHNVGAAAAFTGARRKELVAELEPYRVDLSAGEGHPWMGGEPEGRRPGAPSRWHAGKDRSFELLRPEMVCEVAYDHLQGDRFRHVASFRRWRPDRRPDSCTYAQLAVAVPEALAKVLGGDLRPG
ncbi:MAG TPA: ATP-dependent DNA ligase [Acidimicrobiales bacterium]|nr:ATP-dependent DNA ligase [Acidimicrobiales bacterium]